MRWLALLALAVAAGTARAQDPDDGPRTDPGFTPAQFTQPGRLAPQGDPLAGSVADPATPVVRIQVRTPAHLAPTKPLVYRVVVSNTSSATAYKVVVRHPRPDGVEGPAKCEPNPDPGQPGATDLTWKFAELKPGATKEVTLTYEMAKTAKSVTAKAFVSFEHGQAVTTDREEPKVTIRKSAPEKAVGTEPIPVRVQVTNTSRVAVRDIDVVEDIPPGFEFVADGDSEPTKNRGQRTWRIKELAAGQSRVIDYKVRVRGERAGEFTTTSNVKAGDVTGITEPAKSVTKILTPELRLDVTGPPTRPLGEPAEYTIEVTNTGNTTLTSVRVVADVPADCTVKSVTNGGQRVRDQVIWDLPVDRKNGPLGPTETATVRLKLVANRVGVKKLAVNADGGRGVEQSKTVTTTFTGVAGLRYDVSLEPGLVPVGVQGIVKYRVRNTGTEAAKNVVLKVKLPTEVQQVEVTPKKFNAVTGEMVFDPVTILPGDEAIYAVSYTAKTPGRAAFASKLTADGLAEPLGATKSVTIDPASSP